MAASLAKLLLASALAHQGGAKVLPSVAISAYQKCKEHADKFSGEEEVLKDLHGTTCDELDSDRISDLGITDCEGLTKEIAGMVLTWECLGSVMDGSDPDVDDACSEKKGDELVDCPAALDSAVESFNPMPVEDMDPSMSGEELDAFEFVLGLLKACDAAVEAHQEDSEFVEQIQTGCAEETDPDSMKAMGATYDACEEVVRAPFQALASVVCIVFGVINPELDHLEAVEKDVVDFAESFIGHAEEDGLEAEVEGEMSGERRRALKNMRLYSVVQNIKHLPSFRKQRASWSPASIASVAAASASALAVLGLLAWRRRSAKCHSAECQSKNPEEAQLGPEVDSSEAE